MPRGAAGYQARQLTHLRTPDSARDASLQKKWVCRQTHPPCPKHTFFGIPSPLSALSISLIHHSVWRRGRAPLLCGAVGCSAPPSHFCIHLQLSFQAVLLLASPIIVIKERRASLHPHGSCPVVFNVSCSKQFPGLRHPNLMNAIRMLV